MTGPRKLLLASLAAVVVTAVAGWFRPVPGDVPPGTLPPEPWRLPAAAALERSSVALTAQASSVRWLGAAGGTDVATGDGASSWTLLGVVSDRTEPAALVQAAGKPDVLRVTPGSALPDGALLVAIERGGVVFERDGCRGRRPIHPNRNDEAAGLEDACATSQAHQENSSP
jgi:hypothetical protein